MRVFDDGSYVATWGESAALYAVADKAVAAFLKDHPDVAERESVEDLRQEGVTWLLESPGRAWVRAVDGATEDPEEQLVSDIAAHLEREHRVF